MDSVVEFVQIPIGGTVLSLSALDPNNYIINYAGSISKDITLRLSENHEPDLVHIYPNPTTGPLNIIMPYSGDYEITLINAAGQVVQQSTAYKTSTIEIGNEMSGYYIVQIRDLNGATIRRKVIKL